MQETDTAMPHIELESLLKVIDEEKIPRRLEYVYSQVPEQNCGGCVECCFGGAQVYPIEFFNILSYLLTLDELAQARVARRFIEYELFHLTTLKFTCPLLENGSCMIAARKPLLCRFFGRYPEDEYAEMLAKSRYENERLAMGYARFHRLLLPKEVLTHDVDECKINVSGDDLKVVTSEERQRLHQQIYSLSEQVMPEEWLSTDVLRVSFQYALFYFTEDELEEARIDAIRDFQAGSGSAALDGLAAKYNFRLQRG